MRNIRIKSGAIYNMRGTETRFVEFGDNATVISGRNKCGKTTFKDSFFWLLTGLNSDGSDAKNNRPVNADGSLNLDVEVIADFTIIVDDHEWNIRRSEIRKFNKKTNEYGGNVTTILVNGIPKKQKDFAEWVEENICNPSELPKCLSSLCVLSLDQPKRRAALMSLADDVSDEDVIATNEDFARIKDILKDGTVAELISRDRYQLNGRGRTDKGLNGQLNDIPVRINEIYAHGVDSKPFKETLDALTKKKSELESAIAQVPDYTDDLKKRGQNVSVAKSEAEAYIKEVSSKRSERIREINGEIKDIEYRINGNSMKELAEIGKSTYDIKNNINAEKLDIVSADNRIDFVNKLIKAKQENCDDIKKECERINSEVFDEKTAKTCPVTGKICNEIDITDAKKRFEADKRARYNNLVKKHNNIKVSANGLKEEIETLKETISEREAHIKKMESNLKKLEKKAESLSKVDITSLPEYKKLIEEKASLSKEYDFDSDEKYMAHMIVHETALNDLQNINSKQATADSERETLNTELSTIEDNIKYTGYQIYNCNNNQRRVDDLRDEQRRLAEQIGKIEQEIDLLKQFQVAKVKMITEKINAKFKYVQWVLFEENISTEGFKEVCKPTVNGVDYYTTLNGGAKIIAQVDIACTFQNANGIIAPIWIDEASIMTTASYEQINLLADGRQLISLKASEEEFTVTTY